MSSDDFWISVYGFIVFGLVILFLMFIGSRMGQEIAANNYCEYYGYVAEKFEEFDRTYCINESGEIMDRLEWWNDANAE